MLETLRQKQPELTRIFEKNIRTNRLAHAYLFEGETGVGKNDMSIWLAQSQFCLTPVDGLPCEECNNCLRIVEHEFPDVLEVAPDGQSIKVDQIRALKAEFMKSGMESNKRVFIIQSAEKMGTGAANSLLKFLEEPDVDSLAILETASLASILPTIRSRCQVTHFQPLSKAELTDTLVAEGVNPSLAKLLPELTNSYDKALEFAQDEWFETAKNNVTRWYTYLVKKDMQAFVYVQKQLIKTFKEKDAQRLCLNLLLTYFNKQMEQDVENSANKSVIEDKIRIIDEILKAEQKFASNVSFQNVLEQLSLRIVLG
jgi:DNA polymerase-3 subunit delta'